MSTWWPLRSASKFLRARNTANISRRLMCHEGWWSLHGPWLERLSKIAPQPVREASVVSILRRHEAPNTFPGGSWDMRSPETAAPWSTRGGRVGRMVPWGHRRETNTVKWGVDRSTSGGESSLAWALVRQVFFPIAFLEKITVLRSVLYFKSCSWTRFWKVLP